MNQPDDYIPTQDELDHLEHQHDDATRILVNEQLGLRDLIPTYLERFYGDPTDVVVVYYHIPALERWELTRELAVLSGITDPLDRLNALALASLEVFQDETVAIEHCASISIDQMYVAVYIGGHYATSNLDT